MLYAVLIVPYDKSIDKKISHVVQCWATGGKDASRSLRSQMAGFSCDM